MGVHDRVDGAAKLLEVGEREVRGGGEAAERRRAEGFLRDVREDFSALFFRVGGKVWKKGPKLSS